MTKEAETARAQWQKLRAERRMLAAARGDMYRRMRYNGICEALEKSGLPYKLLQDDRDFAGIPLKGYRYRFTSDYDSDAALYIQETFAGRPRRTAREAMDVLEYVLDQRIAELHRSAFPVPDGDR